jgi:hypothetical protein
MNVLDQVVVNVLGEPNLMFGKWFVKVSANSWGVVGVTYLVFNTKEEALAVSAGYEFVQ